MLGSCPISSSIEIAFDARTPIVLDMAWRASIASLADRRMFRGVVLSFETSFRTPSACLILASYSSFRLPFASHVTGLLEGPSGPKRILAQERFCSSSLKDFHIHLFSS